MRHRSAQKLAIKKAIATALSLGGLSLALSLFQNCSSHQEGVTQSSQDRTFAIAQQKAIQLLNSRCVSCHDFATDPVQMEAAGWLVQGSPETSSMYIDAVDQFEPRSGAALTDSELAILRDWISLLGANWDTVINPPPVDENGDALQEGTYRYVLATVFQAKCTGCHFAGDARGGLNLESYASIGNRAGLILTRMQAVNNPMPPPPAPPASPIDIRRVQEWVDAGAPQ